MVVVARLSAQRRAMPLDRPDLGLRRVRRREDNEREPKHFSCGRKGAAMIARRRGDELRRSGAAALEPRDDGVEGAA